MQVTVQNLEGLERKVDISIPAAEVGQRYQSRLDNVRKTAKIDGYRPGKASPEMIERRFGESVLFEVCGDLIDSSFQNAVKEHQLNIAGAPKVEPKAFAKDQPLEYSATFEVYPEISLKDLSGQSISKPVSAITPEDINKVLHRIQKQHADWTPVDRASVEGDQLSIDFEGFVDGVAFQGGKAAGFQIELGSKQMIPGFEEALVGVKVGDEPTIQVAFPEDYHAKDLAGKPAEFKIKVHKVLEAKEPELNDALALKMGIAEGGIAKLKEQVQKSMQTELDNALKNRLKSIVFDKLIELNPIALPNAALDKEIKHLQSTALHRMLHDQGVKHDCQSHDLPKIDLPREPFLKQAERRLSLGLLLAEVIKKAQIKSDPAAVKARIEEMAQTYHNPEQVIQWYYGSHERLSEIESMVLEEAAINQLLEKAKTSDEHMEFEKVVNNQGEDIE